jgi:catechol 2,3-dioxygenase-like lactoylglutathione lyase family enzyme
MAVQLNHTIVGAKDPAASSAYLAEMLGFGEPARYGPFWVVETDNGVSLDFIEDDEPVPQHYAFLVGEDDWDTIFGRIQERRLEYWADPAQQQPGEINTHDGGRGVYWLDPDGHFLEIITRPYGSGAD